MNDSQYNTVLDNFGEEKVTADQKKFLDLIKDPKSNHEATA